MKTLEIKDLHVTAHGKAILKGLTLTIKPGEVHALMGPNGSGKSTLSCVIAGHPSYVVEKGDIIYDGKSILELSPDERAKLGLFLAFQHPVEIPGLSLRSFLFTLFKAKNPQGKVVDFQRALNKAFELVGLPEGFGERGLNVGLSGGEKKRVEIMQLLISNPSIAILDETDSGLDIDSLKLVAHAVNTLRSPQFGCLVITHYNRILEHLKPDHVHVLIDGRIAQSGDATLPSKLEKQGYAWLHEVPV
jgi:Fe-S cluster assembly ATP-binding protein